MRDRAGWVALAAEHDIALGDCRPDIDKNLGEGDKASAHLEKQTGHAEKRQRETERAMHEIAQRHRAKPADQGK